MTDHSPEPWAEGDRANFQADADRICAAVNACQRVPTHLLNEGVVARALDLLAHLDEDAFFDQIQGGDGRRASEWTLREARELTAALVNAGWQP